MPRITGNKTPKKNVTEEKLRATPFEGIDELNEEEASIRLAVWRRFTEGKIVDELLSKPEGEHLRKEWEAGLLCFLGSDTKNNIYKIYSEGRGLKLQLNKEFAKTLGDHEVTFLEGIVRAGIEGYGSLYMKSKSIIQTTEGNTQQQKGLGKKK